MLQALFLNNDNGTVKSEDVKRNLEADIDGGDFSKAGIRPLRGFREGMSPSDIEMEFSVDHPSGWDQNALGFVSLPLPNIKDGKVEEGTATVDFDYANLGRENHLISLSGERIGNIYNIWKAREACE